MMSTEALAVYKVHNHGAGAAEEVHASAHELVVEVVDVREQLCGHASE